MSMDDAVAVGIVKAVVLLGLLSLVTWLTLNVLRFVAQHFWAIAISITLVAALAWIVITEPFGHINPEYYIAVPVLGAIGLGALMLAYEMLWKLERLWDRALEARRRRKLQSSPPWGAGPPEP